MTLKDMLIAGKFAGGGGGEEPSGTKQISISANGTTTHNIKDYASAEITAAVPNSYTAGDEGKVVSSGALVAQTAHSDVTPTTSDQTIDTILNNSLKVKGDADLVAGNIKKDVEIFGVTGSYEGGGGKSFDEYLDDYLKGDITEIVYTGSENLLGISFGKNTLHKFIGTNTPKFGVLFQWNTGLQIAAFPKATSFDNNGTFQGNSSLTTVDIGSAWRIPNNTFGGCSVLKTIVMRKSDSLVQLAGTAVIATNTPFASGGTGGTIYIPKVFYDHLGDGTSNDYKAASNWSTVDGYGTITWAKIEGSAYESEDWWNT